jgi:hypothetical protein
MKCTTKQAGQHLRRDALVVCGGVRLRHRVLARQPRTLAAPRGRRILTRARPRRAPRRGQLVVARHRLVARGLEARLSVCEFDRVRRARRVCGRNPRDARHLGRGRVVRIDGGGALRVRGLRGGGQRSVGALHLPCVLQDSLLYV